MSIPRDLLRLPVESSSSKLAANRPHRLTTLETSQETSYREVEVESHDTRDDWVDMGGEGVRCCSETPQAYDAQYVAKTTL